MSEEENKNDGFEEIIANMGDEENDEDDFDKPIDVVAHYWKHFNKGHIFIKGLLIVEAETPRGRTLMFESTSPSSEWEVLGMLESVKSQMQARSVLDLLTDIDDEDEEEDEQ